MTDQPKRGRPSLRSSTIAEEIVRRLSGEDGKPEPMAVICRDDHMPSVTTVWRWMEEDAEFSKAIARAREVGEEAMLADCIEIAHDGTNDYNEQFDKDGQSVGWRLNAEHVQRSKLRIETTLKLLAKWNPKKFGDKVDLNHSGTVNVTRRSYADAPDPDAD